MDVNDTHHRDTRLNALLWPSWERRKRLLRTEAWLFVIASYTAVLLGYLWPTNWHSESTGYVLGFWAAFMARTFLFHLGLVLALIFLIALRCRQRRLWTACLPVLMITLGPSLLAFWPKHPATPTTPFRVMTVNLLMVNQTTGPLADEIARNAPDVLLLQELTEAWRAALETAIGKDYPYRIQECRDDSFGAAIYSRHAFAEPPQCDLHLGDSDTPQMRAVISLAGGEIAFYNIHLLPPRSLDYLIEQRRQFAALLNMLESESLPVLVAGDFNFTERSPHAHAIERMGFRDTHDLAGWGRCATWPVNSILRWVPGLRLDHLYLSEKLVCGQSQTGTGQGSDHRPVVAEVGWRQSRPVVDDSRKSTTIPGGSAASAPAN